MYELWKDEIAAHPALEHPMLFHTQAHLRLFSYPYFVSTAHPESIWPSAMFRCQPDGIPMNMALVERSRSVWAKATTFERIAKNQPW